MSSFALLWEFKDHVYSHIQYHTYCSIIIYIFTFESPFWQKCDKRYQESWTKPITTICALQLWLRHQNHISVLTISMKNKTEQNKTKVFLKKEQNQSASKHQTNLASSFNWIISLVCCSKMVHENKQYSRWKKERAKTCARLFARASWKVWKNTFSSSIFIVGNGMIKCNKSLKYWDLLFVDTCNV